MGDFSLVTSDFCKEGEFSFKRQGDVRYGSIWKYFSSCARHAWGGITPLLEVEKALGIEWISEPSWISEHAKGREQLAGLTHFAFGRGPLWGNDGQLGFRLLWKQFIPRYHIDSIHLANLKQDATKGSKQLEVGFKYRRQYQRPLLTRKYKNISHKQLAA